MFRLDNKKIVVTGAVGLLGKNHVEVIASYWANQNIRCNAICPGGVENSQPVDFLKKVTSRNPMERLAHEEEYKGTLIWMLSDASSYLNGAIIPVDSGQILGVF